MKIQHLCKSFDGKMVLADKVNIDFVGKVNSDEVKD